MIDTYRTYREKLKDKCIELLSSENEEDREKGKYLKGIIKTISNNSNKKEVQWCEDY